MKHDIRLTTASHRVATSTPNPSCQKTFFPREHGSWSLAFEPIVFGLLVAPTSANAALALSATAAFFLRRPLKTIGQTQSRAAWSAVALLGTCAAGGLGEAIALGGWPPILLLTPSLPLAALFWYWDRQNEARAVQAELAASSIFALLPAAMALQAGQSLGAAAAQSAIMLVRSIPTVLIVRTYLRLRKGQRVSLRPATITLLTSAFVMLVLSAYRYAPWLATGLVLLSTLRLGLLSPRIRPDWPARRIGIGEAIFGVIYIITIALSHS